MMMVRVAIDSGVLLGRVVSAFALPGQDWYLALAAPVLVCSQYGIARAGLRNDSSHTGV